MLRIFLGIRGEVKLLTFLGHETLQMQRLFRSARLTNPAIECSGAKMYYLETLVHL